MSQEEWEKISRTIDFILQQPTGAGDTRGTGEAQEKTKEGETKGATSRTTTHVLTQNMAMI